MIPLSTIDFDVVKARQNGQSTVCRKSFGLIHLSRQIELDEPWEVVTTGSLFSFPAIRCWGGNFTMVLGVAYVG